MNEETAPLVPVPTFDEFSKTLIANLESGLRNEKHRAQWSTSLRDHAKPILNKRVDEITTDDVLACLRPIWSEKAVTAVRVRGRIEQVLSTAKAAGHRTGENPAVWRGHLERLLARRQKLQQKHLAAMPYEQCRLS